MRNGVAMGGKKYAFLPEHNLAPKNVGRGYVFGGHEYDVNPTQGALVLEDTQCKESLLTVGFQI